MEPPETPAPERRWPRLARWAVSLGGLAAVAVVTGGALFWGERGWHSYRFDGVAARSALLVLIGPVVGGNPWPKDLKIEQFVPLPTGTALVRAGGRVWDYGGASPLTAEKDEVVSFGLVEGALTVLTREGRLAAWSEGGLLDLQDVLDKTRLKARPVRLESDAQGSRFFLFFDGPDNPLVRLSAKKLEVLTGSPEPIAAVCADAERTLFAVGEDLFELRKPGEPLLIHSASRPILGLAARGKAVYYSTAGGVYRLKGKDERKVIEGLAGPLSASEGGLYVLDSASGRLFRIRGA